MGYPTYESPKDLKDIWTTLSRELREITSELSDLGDKLYESEDPVSYSTKVYLALKLLIGVSQPVNKLSDLQRAMHDLQHIVLSPGKQEKAVTLLKYTQNTTEVLTIIRKLCERLCSAHQLLKTHCNSYQNLYSDTEVVYYQLSLRMFQTTEKLKELSAMFDALDNGCDYSVYFSEDDLSLDISVVVDCDSFPVLRLLPDLLQKLNAVSSLCQNWLRNDKVYVEILKTESERLKDQVSQQEANINRTETKKDQLLLALKVIQGQVGYSCIQECEHLRKLEDNGSAIENNRLKELENTANEINDFTARIKRLSKRKVRENEELQMFLLRLSYVEEALQVRTNFSNERETKTMVSSSKTAVFINRRRSLDSVIPTKHQSPEHIRHSELIRRRSCGEVKIVPEEKVSSQLITLNLPVPPLSTIKASFVQSKPRRINSAELQRAFRIVKDSIGLGWKELARSLPYFNGKRVAEIESDIAEIEYQHKGQLKEQAYQCLIAWYNHNGKRATVTILCETLRELNEERLAEKLEESRVILFLPDIHS